MALGREDEAHAAIEEVLRINPDLTLEKQKKIMNRIYKDSAYRTLFIDSLRKAGFK
jgi:adenylate cyclase